MVSALTTTRLLSSQMALQLLQTPDASQDSSSDPLLDDSSSSSSSNDVSSLPSQSQASLTSMLNGLSANQTDSSATSQSDPDMTSSSFMSLLKQNLQDAVKSEGKGGQAQAMLDALDNGTLTVSDPTKGVSITAWDASADSEQGTTSKTGDTIPTSDWNDFLKAHLERGSDGTFVKNSDGSFIDKVTGNEAYFGQVGSQYYYITWPSASSDTNAESSAVSASEKTSA
ncbi:MULTISPECIES: hypothetical protein [Rhizobium]|uniref:Uncharacterized protein n=1 Tax=Rhizobium paranaense TaxID=1650438 RepID=A0A7W8XT45_9HYPH|nr:MULTISPECIES: hypothetical protein [Rhizobium]MBB5575112.1 hypothetical protein [Rhizobium paranaense]PST64456.1 hypothetical protein C9E91_02940 [Rhizobium sp. SEMIA4064]